MKIAKLPDRMPIKFSFSASPSLAKSLALYAQYYEKIYLQAEPVSELLPYALEAFLESDRGFTKFRREHEVSTEGDASRTSSISS
jgi:hypothetical protein